MTILGPTLLLCLAIPQGTDPGPQAHALSAAAAREDLTVLREAVEVIHPGLGRYVPASVFEEQWQVLFDGAAEGTTDLELYRDVSLLVAGLRCGHSRVEAPQWVDTYREEHPTHLPFHFRLISGRMFIEVADDEAQLPRGTEVVTIDGSPVAELIAELAPTVPVDGWTDAIRPSRLQTAYEFQDSGLDHYLPYFPRFEGFREEFTLDVRPVGSETSRKLTVPAIDSERWAALEPDAGWRDFIDAVSWRVEDEGTAVLEVGTFVNYRRPVDPVATFARVFREIREAGVKHLILDLRACGGGSSDVGWTLARFLIDRPVPLGGRPRLKNIRFGNLVPHLSTWAENAFEQPAENFEQLDDGWFEVREDTSGALAPHPERFEGRITILIGPYNASGTTMLLAKLREGSAAQFVGEPTGGSAEGPTAGVIFFLTLPNSGVRVNVPVLRETNGVREFRAGYGVEPDVNVTLTIEDFLAGKDPVLEAALAPPMEEPASTEELPGVQLVGRNAQGFEEYALSKDPSVVLVLVPGGTFRIGSDDGDFDERPRTPVTLSPYLIAKHELTNAQYARFCRATEHPLPPAPLFDADYMEARPDLPVLNLTWEDARAYCDWAGLDLPTEAQWEFAALGDDGRRFPWGDESPAKRDVPHGEPLERGPQAGGEVASDASPFGILDLASNVSEWCFDAYEHYPADAVTDPSGADPASATHHVFRGGSWQSRATYLRPANRNWMELEWRGADTGVRPALWLR